MTVIMETAYNPTLANLPSEIRLKIYAYVFTGFSMTCNWDMQPKFCLSCFSTHDIINVLRAAPAADEDKRQYCLSAVSRKIRLETLPLISKTKCELHVLGPSLVIGAPPNCRGQFDLPKHLVARHYVRSLVLDRSLPQLPDFSQLPNLESITLPAPHHGAHAYETHLPSNKADFMDDRRIMKSFMYKLGLYDFGHWTHRVRDALEAHDLSKEVSLRIRRTMFIAGRDKSVYLDVDMELHKAPDGRLGPERITGCAVDVDR